MAQCVNCGVAFLTQRPDAASLGDYYPQQDYYAYLPREPYDLFRRTEVAARSWYCLKRSVLAYDYGYRHLGGNGVLAQLMRLTPGALRTRATFGLSVLLHPWRESGHLLEIGCGSGTYLDLMRALGWARTVGVDFSPTAVEEARTRLGLEVYCGNLRDLALPEATFDAVSLSHTLEHIPEPIGLLQEVRRIMKPGGRLAIVVPNWGSLCAKVFGRSWWALDPPRHVVNFDPRSLRLSLERAGLVTEKLFTSSRMAYITALYSEGRRLGDDRSIYGMRPGHFSLQRRLRALRLALFEHAQCFLGRAVGEELLVVGRRATGTAE